MTDEYIIINKTTLEKRKEERKKVCNKELSYASDKIYSELDHLLSQSTLLVPEIEKAFEAGRNLTIDGFEEEDFKDYEKYILNLKLSI